MADALALVGDRWSLHVVREIAMGVQRFDAIQRRTGAPREMLASRLRKLEAAGVLTRSRYSDRPPRYEYALTASGEELLPVMAGLYAWGAAHATHALPDEQAPVPAAEAPPERPGHVR